MMVIIRNPRLAGVLIELTDNLLTVVFIEKLVRYLSKKFR